MRYATVLLILMLCACSIKSGNNQYDFMQMQVREGSASIYSSKVYGVSIGVPVPSVGKFDFTLGYISRTESLIPTNANGELPDVLIDLSTTHGDNTQDLSDTYATGDASLSIYPEESTELPKLP